MHINCPTLLDDENAARFINSIWRTKDEELIVLNFSTLHFVYPSGVLISAIGIRSIVKKRKEQGLRTQISGHLKKGGAISYLGFFGYFCFIGIDVGNKPNHITGGRTYLPITEITSAEFNDPNAVIQEQIKKKAYDLATLIFPKHSEATKVDMLAYCIQEVMRNVFEHAETDKCFLMAQKWSNGIAEIAIADEGIGIPTSLSKSHKINSPRAAIRLAIKPGITSNVSENNDDYWQNTGFGLYVISEIGKENGSFSLLSNETMLLCSGEEEIWIPTPIEGTIVKLRASTRESDYFPNILKSIVAQGEIQAEQIPGAVKSGSKGSKVFDPLQW